MTKDTTPTPAGRERADSGPLAGTPAATTHDRDAIRARLGDDEVDRTTYWWRRATTAESEVERLTAERDLARDIATAREQGRAEVAEQRDAARAALAAFRADVEAEIVAEWRRNASVMPHDAHVAVHELLDDLAALLAKHAGEDA